MAVELATGYVSIVPSAKGFDRAITSQITGPLSDASKSAGEDAGDGFAAGFTGKAKAGFAVQSGSAKRRSLGASAAPEGMKDGCIAASDDQK